jgi:hypothetical protein
MGIEQPAAVSAALTYLLAQAATSRISFLGHALGSISNPAELETHRTWYTRCDRCQYPPGETIPAVQSYVVETGP